MGELCVMSLKFDKANTYLIKFILSENKFFIIYTIEILKTFRNIDCNFLNVINLNTIFEVFCNRCIL